MIYLYLYIYAISCVFASIVNVNAYNHKISDAMCLSITWPAFFLRKVYRVVKKEWGK